MTGSTDGATYSTVQRGSGLDRSGSFRGSGVTASGTTTSRNAPPSTETMSASQNLSLEPFPIGEHKQSRSGEIRRVLRVSVDEHSFVAVQNKPLSPITSDDLKRLKGSVIESGSKARDRGKLLQECIQKVDKYCNVLRKPRRRNDVQPSERSGSNLFKMGNQMLLNPLDNASVRPEDRGKNGAPNKRARSSLSEQAEGRASVPARQDKNMLLEKDKAILWSCNGVATPMEDKIRGLPAGGDGWDKKMKRKRSVGTMITRIPEGDRDCKPAAQQRSANEPHSRNNDGHVFRSGISASDNSNKADSNSQLRGAGSHVPRNDLDIGPPTSDRRDRPLLLDKERSIAKGSTKLNMNDEAQSGNQSSLTKGKASRQPRTGSTAIINSSFDLPRSLGGMDGREQPPGVNKKMPLQGTINQKRSLPTGSSSPPMAQWVGQRPQKISRTRRQHVFSPVSNFDENQNLSEGYPAPDHGPRASSSDPAGLLLSRGLPNSTQQLKLKPENIPSPAGFSEGEESGAVEIAKTKDKEIENGEVEDGILGTGHKNGTIVLPIKKDKAPVKDKFGDGVRRQGRSGRGSAQPKTGLPLAKENHDSVETNKPGRIGRSSPDKSESRIGRPPSKKGSDRKTSTRPIQAINNASELMGESDDDHEEMMAAANAARNANYDACSNSSFWKKMDPYFCLASVDDIDYLKCQINFVEDLDRSFQDTDTLGAEPYGELEQRAERSPHSVISMENNHNQQFSMDPKKLVDNRYGVDGAQLVQRIPRRLETERWFEKRVSLSQRLLSAIIVEDAIEKIDSRVEQVDKFLHISNEEYPYCSNSLFEDDHREKNNVKPGFKTEADFDNQNRSTRKKSLCNGFAPSANFCSSQLQNKEVMHEPINENIPSHASRGKYSECGQTNSVLLQNDAGFCGSSPGDSQYEQLSLDERILMELNSIGIHPNTVPDVAEGKDEELGKNISELKTKLYLQMKKKKGQFQKLESTVLDARPTEENNFLRIAMDKLVEAAYKKHMGGRSHSHKSGASKMAKQLAAAFAKRTLIRLQIFEKTGQTCFSEPPLRDVLFSSSQGTNDAAYLDGTTCRADNESHSIPVGSKPAGKMKEVLLDDVIGGASRPTLTNVLPQGNVKGKRTERDRDQNKDASARNNGRGDRKMKPKPKPKQKIAQLTAAGNGILGRGPETSNQTTSRQESCVTANNSTIVGLNQESGNGAMDLRKEIHDSMLTNLLDEAVGLSGQGQDIASWLNVEDDMLQDNDNLVGLEIPMDDLSELKLNF